MKQIEKLKEGAHSWNQWRSQNRDVPLNMHGANLQGVKLQGVRLKNVNFSGTNLQDADLKGAQMIRAVLVSTNLEGADMERANLEGGNLTSAMLEGANLVHANLRRALLKSTDLKDANLREADLEGADLRFVKSIRLDRTRTKDAQFSNRAKDPWSVLRRTYTGPKFAFLFIGLVAFALPYAAKIGFWSSVNRGQEYTQGLLETIRQRAHEQGIDEQTIAAMGLSPENVKSFVLCLNDACEVRPIWQLLLGVDQNGLFWLVPVVLVVYNALRGFLTYSVAPMRDEEERSGWSPNWKADNSEPGYCRLYKLHICVSWLGRFALAAFFYNAYYWLSLPIYFPK